jgi:YD repeat-containing protein
MSGSTSFVYDVRGNVTQEMRIIGGVGFVTAYAYDLANRVTQVTYPSGRLATYSRDAMGRITGITTQANGAATPATVASGAAYLPFGPRAALTSPADNLGRPRNPSLEQLQITLVALSR